MTNALESKSNVPAALTVFALLVFANAAAAQSEAKQVADHLARLGDPAAKVRSNAADELGLLALKIKDAAILQPAIAKLLPLMGDADMDVRDETAEAIGVIASRIKDDAAVKSAIAALIKALADKSGEVREESAEALARIASTVKNKALLAPAVRPLIKALVSGRDATRDFAREALKSLGKTETIEAIATIAAVKEAEQANPLEPTALPPAAAKRTRYLLLDSRIIDKLDNVHLTVGVVDKEPANPLFKEDKPWEPRFDNPYSSVIYDEEEKIYKCWYSIFIRSGGRGDFPGEGLASEKRAWVKWREGRRSCGVCYATSKDGIKWTKPNLGLIDYNGSKANNIVIEYTHGVAVLKDLHETDPKKRYKAIHPERSKSMVWFSADGIRWGKPINVGPIDRGDTNQSVWWDPALKKYVLITRGWGGAKTTGRYGRAGHRQKVRSESPDFLKWSKVTPAISGLDLRNQIHDMLVTPHAGVYIGLVGLFDIKASRQWCELAWSPDSKKWIRIQPGQPLIPNSRRMGDYDWGCIFAAKPIIRKDEIILYYGSNDGRFMAWRNGFFCLARLRPDGFAGYEQIEGGSNKTGSLTTKPVTAVTGALQITADIAPSGFVKTTVFDKDNKQLGEGKLVTKTVTDAEIQWKDGFSLKKLKGTEIKLKFELRESKLYSFNFGDGSATKGQR